jgi:hypothetical protein
MSAGRIARASQPVGSSDRKRRRALEALGSTYAAAITPHRLAIGDARGAVTGDDPDARAAAIAAVIGHHRRALRAALAAADREGTGWMAREGTDEARLSARLWDDHIAPLLGVPAAHAEVAPLLGVPAAHAEAAPAATDGSA